MPEALRVLREPAHLHWLEHHEPTSKKTALFYTGPQSLYRPTIFRYHTRLFTRFGLLFPSTVVFPGGTKPYSQWYSKEMTDILKQKNVNLVTQSTLGPVPFELDEMYPLAQSVFPMNVDRETQETAEHRTGRFLQDTEVIHWREGMVIKTHTPPIPPLDFDIRRISAVADMQLGPGESDALFTGKIHLVKSKRTGKIRNIDREWIPRGLNAGGGWIIYLETRRRPQTPSEAEIPVATGLITDDAAPFVTEGKSVFAKFVSDCDPDLRPFDECVIVDEQDKFLGIGRKLLTRNEMLSFRHGMAVKTRESIKKG